jgi:hypothetical protein
MVFNCYQIDLSRPIESGVAALCAANHGIVGQNCQISGTRKTDTAKNQISRGNPSFQ